MPPALIAIALLRATSVFEEWTLHDEAPLRESVVVRAHYPQAETRDALLPPAMTRHVALSVWDAASGAPLPHRCDVDACVVSLPASGPRRVIARFERPAATPRAFLTHWPPRGSSGARRVATLPRSWSNAEPPGWRCPGLDPDELVCVDHGDAAPIPLRVPARPSTPPQRAVAAIASVTSLAAASRLGRDPFEATLAAAGGVAVAVACALAVVGGRHSSWAAALALLLPLGALAGAAATRRRSSRIVGAVALGVVPVAVVLRAPPAVALGAAAAVALAPAVAVSSPATSR